MNVEAGTVERLELLLAAIADALVLDRDQLDAADTFLDLGGDSLAALYVCEALAASGYSLEPVDLFADDPLARVAIGIRPATA